MERGFGVSRGTVMADGRRMPWSNQGVAKLPSGYCTTSRSHARSNRMRRCARWTLAVASRAIEVVVSLKMYTRKLFDQYIISYIFLSHHEHISCR
jgi:hypothetical protein